jgi:Rrf2 family protein
MRVSQRLDYALRALTALAAVRPGAYMVAGDLADELGLPRRFLEQQLTAVAKRGLVTCQRGAGGGCALARPASEITVADVVRALQGDVLDVPRVTGSAVSEMWADAAARLEGELAGVDLATLAKRQAALDAAATPMYYI